MNVSEGGIDKGCSAPLMTFTVKKCYSKQDAIVWGVHTKRVNVLLVSDSRVEV